MSATVGRGSRTFENKKAIGEAIMVDRCAAAPRVVAFEQVLAKNRIRPMTSYHKSGSNTVMSRQAVANFGGQLMSRVKSANIMPDSAGAFASGRKRKQHAHGPPKTSAQ